MDAAMAGSIYCCFRTAIKKTPQNLFGLAQANLPRVAAQALRHRSAVRLLKLLL
jgi:hypothetical protein